MNDDATRRRALFTDDHTLTLTSGMKGMTFVGSGLAGRARPPPTPSAPPREEARAFYPPTATPANDGGFLPAEQGPTHPTRQYRTVTGHTKHDVTVILRVGRDG